MNHDRYSRIVPSTQRFPDAYKLPGVPLSLFVIHYNCPGLSFPVNYDKYTLTKHWKGEGKRLESPLPEGQRLTIRISSSGRANADD